MTRQIEACCFTRKDLMPIIQIEPCPERPVLVPATDMSEEDLEWVRILLACCLLVTLAIGALIWRGPSPAEKQALAVPVPLPPRTTVVYWTPPAKLAEVSP